MTAPILAALFALAQSAGAQEIALQPCGCRAPQLAAGRQLPAAYHSDWGSRCAPYDVGCDNPDHCCRPYCVVDRTCSSALPHPLLTSVAATGAVIDGDEVFFISYSVCFDDSKSRQECSTESQLAWQKLQQTRTTAGSACECTSSNRGIPVWKFGANYGTSCGAWDIDNCREWWDGVQGATMGQWCCEPWCYVSKAACPSARRSSLNSDLYFAYGTCGVDLKAAYTCPYTEEDETDSRSATERRPMWSLGVMSAASMPAAIVCVTVSLLLGGSMA